jgi:lysyl-tRNA synthetase class I
VAAEPLAELAEHVRPFVDTGRFPGAVEHFREVVDTLRTRLSTYADVNEHLGLLYPSDAEVGPRRAELGTNTQTREVLAAVRDRVAAERDWSQEGLDAAGASVEAKGASLFHPVREVLIGSEKGPDLGKIMMAVGREEALRRFDEALGR